MDEHKLHDEPPYRLPSDNTEMAVHISSDRRPRFDIWIQRLSLQHRMWCVLFGGLNPPSLHKINELLSAEDGSSAVLDVGCRSGIWAVEMGETYPHADIIGVDLNVNNDVTLPLNVRFVQLDITLPPRDGGYDVIHARCHLKDPTAFVQTAYAALKPGIPARSPLPFVLN
ncbi:S-adenosyl-L-methionine-dependent methyltransferase [Mycena maculata]|uniref:S-adenosyl-L-methionine-dependent methyltransferase n=1 Tax=Mycena maculata TaxID=230809 RepID=A0AAD7JY10_9AGAR|nr:S-adenosyl-L-methionine-dependent methyltransferase [Mycena maculata]